VLVDGGPPNGGAFCQNAVTQNRGRSGWNALDLTEGGTTAAMIAAAEL
jgi:hypothetical protein